MYNYYDIYIYAHSSYEEYCGLWLNTNKKKKAKQCNEMMEAESNEFASIKILLYDYNLLLNDETNSIQNL